MESTKKVIEILGKRNFSGCHLQQFPGLFCDKVVSYLMETNKKSPSNEHTKLMLTIDEYTGSNEVGPFPWIGNIWHEVNKRQNP
jgi:hypothetical protein